MSLTRLQVELVLVGNCSGRLQRKLKIFLKRGVCRGKESCQRASTANHRARGTRAAIQPSSFLSQRYIRIRSLPLRSSRTQEPRPPSRRLQCGDPSGPDALPIPSYNFQSSRARRQGNVQSLNHDWRSLFGEIGSTRDRRRWVSSEVFSFPTSRRNHPALFLIGFSVDSAQRFFRLRKEPLASVGCTTAG